ncbi:MAG: S-layer homology domain-containing protein [Cyanobacteria bacterium SIG28]|nr:S-layer homology domain-containing protein [Cyanobacteria bacterium SIG28]
MKVSKELLMALGVLCVTTGVANATNSIQAYAHPTLFGSQGHALVTTESDVIVGGRIYKPCHVKTIEGKQNVVVGRYAKQILGEMKSKMDAKRGALYDPKMPVLRSELAFLISEGLGLTKGDSTKYTDITDGYWAKAEIERALTADVMIGYPDSTFQPDKAITKAEVFCTFAKLMNLDSNESVPTLNGQTIKYVPEWAYKATNEVLASGLLGVLPNTDKVINDEYLSKEQVAYFISAMKKNFQIDISKGAIGCASKYEPVAVKIKLSERISARTSNVGDTFTAKTTQDVTLAGTTYPAGSTVKGKVTSVARPGVKKPGYIEVQFENITNGENCIDFPRHLSSAQVDVMKNPNIISRLLGAPFSMTGRVAGVAGRTISEGAEVIANGVEEYGGNWSDAFADTASLHPLKGLKSVGSSFITVGKGVYNLSKLAVSGTFGVLYEFYDECKYLIVPNTTNDSCLNPDEELTIIF